MLACIVIYILDCKIIARVGSFEVQNGLNIIFFFLCMQAGLAKLIGLAGETNVQASNILILKPLCGFSMFNFIGYL